MLTTSTRKRKSLSQRNNILKPRHRKLLPSKNPLISSKIIVFILVFISCLFLFYTLYKSPSLTTESESIILDIAISILLTKDPGTSGGFLDSITALSLSIDSAKSVHNIHKIALIHSEITECIPVLKHFGFEIISRSVPITLDDIENKKYAKELEHDGCCGILELLSYVLLFSFIYLLNVQNLLHIELEVWTMNEFDYIIAMDADMHFHGNFDALFDKMSLGNIQNAKSKNNDKYKGKYLGWTHGADADMKIFHGELMNGGFLVVRPNKAHYDAMYEIIKEGDFRDNTAWKGSKIGWCYGGRSIQGIVPFYYYHVIGTGVADVEVDRCVFNNMVEIEKCRKYKYSQVISNHFTWCQKPWFCRYQANQPLCMEFNKQWWNTSRRVEQMLGIEPREECPKNTYIPIDYTKSAVISL